MQAHLSSLPQWRYPKMQCSYSLQLKVKDLCLCSQLPQMPEGIIMAWQKLLPIHHAQYSTVE